MALTDLLNIRIVLGGEGSDLGPDVYRELLVMMLARAAEADTHTDAAEVQTVQKVLQEHLSLVHKRSMPGRFGSNVQECYVVSYAAAMCGSG